MEKKINKKNKLLWSVISVLIAGVSIWAVTAQNKDFSAEDFFAFASGTKWYYLAAAFVCMLGFIVFEACSLKSICKGCGYKISHRDGFFYSASDIYFSAITPSATGGQPACAYFMMGDGVPGMFVTVALIANLAMYTLSIIVIAIICFVFRPGLINNFSTVSVILIFIGFAAQLVLLLFFVLLLSNKKLLSSICNGGIKILRKLRIIRLKTAAKWRRKLNGLMEDYDKYTQLLKGKKRVLFKMFIFNFLQRVSQIAVTVFTFLATGGSLPRAIDMFFLQSYVVLGTNCVPIPGAMGVTDFLMLDCFRSIMDTEAATNIELLSRSISFYFCIIICGVSVVIKYLLQRKQRKKTLQTDPAERNSQK